MDQINPSYRSTPRHSSYSGKSPVRSDENTKVLPLYEECLRK